MTQSATEGGQQAGTTDQGAAGAAATGQQAAGTATVDAGQQTGQTTAQQTTTGTAATGTTTTGQQAADDGLTDEERGALSDPGKRALERVRTERETARTELDTTRAQLQEALAKLGQGSDEAHQQQVTTLTTERDTAARQNLQITALLRNGLAVPRPNETGAQFADRMSQLAGMLQGADQAALDASAAVLASLGTGQQAVTQTRTTTGDAHQATTAGQAGSPSMDDAIRAMAGRQVQR